jgi:pilin isopeptide linkage protein
LTASKSAIGAPLPDGRFYFGVFDNYGNLIATAPANAAGSVHFPAVAFTEPGVYNYTIRELSISGGGWTVDGAIYPVTITVTSDDAGRLSASVSYPNGLPDFTNTFSPVPASESVVVFKELHGWNYPEIPFTFGLFDENGDLLATAQNTGGVVQFPQRIYTETGVFHYTVRELTPPEEGWTTDGAVYPVTVTVTEAGGMLIATVTYPNGQPTFVNTFVQPEPTTATIRACKQVCGACLCAGDFTFGLFDESGNEAAQATNDACGNIVFPEFTFTEPRVFNYTMRELNAPSCCWVIDTREYPVIVTVTADGAGQLAANIDYPNGFPVFVNRFCPTQCCC